MKLFAVLMVMVITLCGCDGMGAFNRDGETKPSEVSTPDNSGDVSDNNSPEDDSTPSDEGDIKEKFLANDEGFTLSENITGGSLSTDTVPMGYSANTARDEYGRPLIMLDYQKKYGDKYNAVFVGGDSKTLYLTFTMGYEQIHDGVTNTEKIMDILEEKNVPAVFFVDGGYTRIQPDICKKITDRGFVLGCHGYDHPSGGITSYSPSEQVEDGKKIYNAIYELTGVPPVYYRPGSGIFSEQSMAILSEMGFRTVMYSFSYFDYDTENQPNPDDALNKLVSNLHSGEILYLHTVSDTNVSILPQFIDKARGEGYEFELIR